MSIVVEHEKRRREILEKALDVFIDEGFGNATFQKIADRCGITRTTLYTYFRNKRDIFNFSIKQLLQTLENDLNEIKNKTGISFKEKLTQLMNIILERLEENRRLLLVILNFLVYSSKDNDYDSDYRVRRRTVRLRHMLSTMLIAGIKAGEFIPSLNVKEANELLYNFVESAAFRLVVLRRSSVEGLKGPIELVISGFCIR
ncbi:MAG: TetR/AcrR family transcriptional regulator [Treponema sp.]|nr:TetR/AcrR family transcriptional regulator [Treponema sp.]